MMSFPSRADGIASAWMLLGFLKPKAAHDLHSSGMTPRSAKVLDDVSTPFSFASGDSERDEEPEADSLSEADGDGERDGPALLEAIFGAGCSNRL